MTDACHDCGVPLKVLLVCLTCGGQRYKRDGYAWLQILVDEMGLKPERKAVKTKKKRTSWED